MLLSEDVLDKLKAPLGKIFDEKDVKKELGLAHRIISVGDQTSASLIRAGVVPNMIIVDGKTLRKPIRQDVRRLIDKFGDKTIKIVNNAGNIDEKAWSAIKDNISSDKKIKISVEGEEDLLTIPAALTAPDGSIVVYGQPGEGIVLLKVSKSIKKMFESIIGGKGGSIHNK